MIQWSPGSASLSSISRPFPMNFRVLDMAAFLILGQVCLCFQLTLAQQIVRGDIQLHQPGLQARSSVPAILLIEAMTTEACACNLTLAQAGVQSVTQALMPVNIMHLSMLDRQHASVRISCRTHGCSAQPSAWHLCPGMDKQSWCVTGEQPDLECQGKISCSSEHLVETLLTQVSARRSFEASSGISRAVVKWTCRSLLLIIICVVSWLARSH